VAARQCVASWLLDLTAARARRRPSSFEVLAAGLRFGEGRWTIKPAVDEGVPVPFCRGPPSALQLAGDAEYEDKLLSAMRSQFGGHVEKPGGKQAAG